MEAYLDFLLDNPFLSTLLVITIILIFVVELRRFNQGFKEISPQEAVYIINNEDAFLLDVREDTELQQGIIPNSKHVAASIFNKRFSELNISKDLPVITYCKTGARAPSVCNFLKKRDFQNVYNIKGGISAWVEDSLPISKI
ncbi:MAG: rhodanese-like domain-containing protein [Pseudomonadota bacterium]